MEKKMIATFYKLSEEVPKLREEVINAQHRCLDLQYDLDSREQNRINFEEFLMREVNKHIETSDTGALYVYERVLDKFREKML